MTTSKVCRHNIAVKIHFSADANDVLLFGVLYRSNIDYTTPDTNNACITPPFVEKRGLPDYLVYWIVESHGSINQSKRSVVLMFIDLALIMVFLRTCILALFDRELPRVLPGFDVFNPILSK